MPPLSHVAPLNPPTPLAHPLAPLNLRQDRSILGNGSIRYALAGGALALIGVFALAQGNVAVGVSAIVIGVAIVIAAFLFF